MLGTGARAQEAPAPDPAAIEVPDLNFTPTPAIERDFDKYFYFHRGGTELGTALADFRECDAYARGISLRADGGPNGLLAGAATDAIFGAAQRRDIARRNLRVCLGFKEYRRYGLPKSIWDRIHSVRAPGESAEARRQRLLLLQARIASGPQPRVGVIAE
ncbi:MAG TPA: hypothetical protein VF782_03000 [Allosphingosinicella sp.]